MAHDTKKTDDNKQDDDKKDDKGDDKKSSAQNKWLEYGKTVGAVLVVLFAAMDARVRPVIADAVGIAEQYGIRGSRLVRQLVERHLVAFLRPFLIVSTLTVTATYLLGWRWICALGVGAFGLGEAGVWLGVVAAIATIAPVILIGRVWKVKGLRDADIRTLRGQITVTQLAPVAIDAGRLRQTLEGLVEHVRVSLAVARQSPLMVDTLNKSLLWLQGLADDASTIERQLQTGELAASLASIGKMDTGIAAALQGVVAHLSTPAVHRSANARAVITALQSDLNMLRPAFIALRTQIEQVREHIAPEMHASIASNFGRPGYASRIALTLVAQWAIAAAWFYALGVAMQTWHLAEMQNAHVDPRWTSGLIVMSIILTTVAVGWLTLAVSIAQAAIKYALQPIVWAAKLAVMTTVDWFDGASKAATNMARVVGLPLEELSHSMGAALGFPVGVAFGLLTLSVTGHSINQVGFIVMDAVIWLGVYIFLVRTGRIMNEYLYRLIVTGHSVWMVVGFILWATQPTWSTVTVVTASSKVDTIGVGSAAFDLANVVTPTFVLIVLSVAGLATWLARKASGTSARALYATAVVFAVLGIGMMLARTVYASTPSSKSATSVASKDDGLNLGDLVPERTVNAGSYSAAQGQSCSLTDSNRPCP